MAAAEVLPAGTERRVLISGYGVSPAPPRPESLLGRLDQIDLRLRQLEEQRRRRRRTSSAEEEEDDGDGGCSVPGAQPRHRHSKSMPSALQQDRQQAAALLRGTLMDRLNLLESRIRQLSCELDGSGAAAVPRPAEDRAWYESAVLEPPPPAASRSWGAVQIHRGNGKPTTTKASKKKQAAKEDEKRKKKAAAERGGGGGAAAGNGRRWFNVGC